MACSAVHSDWLVGLLRANMIGRWLMAAISLMTSAVKSPALPAAPVRAHYSLFSVGAHLGLLYVP